MYKNKKAFTIIEFIIVFTIITILILLAIPNFAEYMKKANNTKLKWDLKQIEKQIVEKEANGIKIFSQEYLNQEYIHYLLKNNELFSINGYLENNNSNELLKLKYIENVNNIKDIFDYEEYSVYIDDNYNFYIVENKNLNNYKPSITRQILSAEDLKKINNDIKTIQNWLKKEKDIINSRDYNKTNDFLPGIYISRNIIDNQYNKFDLLHIVNDYSFNGRYLDVNDIKNKYNVKNLEMTHGKYLWEHSLMESKNKVFYMLDYSVRESDEGFYFLENTIMGVNKNKHKDYINNKFENLIIPKNIHYQGEVIPVKNIGYKSFNYTNIDKLTILADLENIDDYAFHNCNIKGHLVLPKSIKHLKRAAFQGNNITSVNLKDLENLIDIDYFTFYRNKIEEVILPKNIVSIENSSFNKNNINKVILNDNLEKIGIFAFANNNIKEITIPKKIKRLNGATFYNNKFENIDNITILNNNIVLKNYIDPKKVPFENFTNKNLSFDKELLESLK